METPQPQVRFRVNVGTSTKGIITWDCTVELTAAIPVAWEQAALDDLRVQVLHEAELMVDALRTRYGRGELSQRLPLDVELSPLASGGDPG